MTFQMSFSGWVLRVSSHARTAISLATRRLRTSTSMDQKHQHQYFPYLLGFSWCSNEHTCHVSPPSIDISTRVTFFPPPVDHTTETRQTTCTKINVTYADCFNSNYNEYSPLEFNWRFIFEVSSYVEKYPTFKVRKFRSCFRAPKLKCYVIKLNTTNN